MAAATVLGAGAAAADVGDIRWVYQAEIAWPGGPVVLQNGDVLWAGTLGCVGLFGGIYRISPNGEMIWHRADVGNNGLPAEGPDGTLYVGDIAGGARPSVLALSPEGNTIWEYVFPPDNTYGFIGGPDVGPDGNIYVTPGVPFGGDGYMLSLTPNGEYRWQVDGYNNGAGCPPSRHVFTDGRVIKMEEETPLPGIFPGPDLLGFDSGLTAIELDGDPAWDARMNVGTQSAHRQPQVLPNGNIVIRLSNLLRAYSPAGEQLWQHHFGYPSEMTAPGVGPDGSSYAVHGYHDLVSLDLNGNVRWIRENVVPSLYPSAPTVSPDGSMVVFTTSSSTVCPGSPFACRGHVLAFDSSDGSLIFNLLLPEMPQGQQPLPNSGVGGGGYEPAFSADSRTLYVSTRGAPAYGSGNPNLGQAYLFAIALAAGPACPADFDGNGTVAVPDIFSFLSAWFAQGPGADFDGNGLIQVPDIFAFLGAWFAGCA